jgi:hypothetical protein
MLANPTPTQEHYIHVPDFLSDYLDSNQPMSQRNDALLVKKRLTTDLITEIHSHFPTSTDISSIDDNNK